MSTSIVNCYRVLTALFLLLVLACKCSAQIVYTEPTRDEVASALRAAGREPVTDELVDSAMLRFRNNWACEPAYILQLVSEPRFVASMDALHSEALGKPATALQIVDGAIRHHVGYDLSCQRKFFRKRLAIERPSVTVHGTVFDDATGEPLQGVLVYNRRTFAMSRTDADGRFRLDGLDPDLGAVSAYAVFDGYADAEIVDAVDFKTGGVFKHDIKMVREASVEGRVVDEAGNPIACVGVAAMVNRSLICRDGSYSSSRFAGGGIVIGTMTDRDGCFRVRGIPPGDDSFALNVSHPNFQSRILSNLHTTDDMPYLITLTPGCEVSGVVTDEAGSPVRGAWVQIRSPNDGGFRFQGHSDADGRFTFLNVAPGAYDVVIETDDYAMAFLPVIASDDKLQTGLQCVVQKGHFISGVVLDAEGKPVPAAAVGWLKPVEGNRSLNRMTQSDALGSFRIGPVPAGEYEITALVDPPRFLGTAVGKTGQRNVLVRLKPESR